MNYFKLHIGTLVIICLGIFFAPAASYACSSKASHPESKCISGKPHHTSASPAKETHKHNCPCDDGCNGNCQHRSCKCDACGCSAGVVVPLLYKSNQHFAVYKKILFPTQQAYVCPGFNSIWLPPKIS